MDGKMDMFTLLSLIVAVVAVLKLYSILGRDTGGDDRRAERQQADRRRASSGDGKVVTLPRREVSQSVEAAQAATGDVALADAEQRVRTYTTDPIVTAGLIDIYLLDKTFDPNHFIKGARQAYEMIVTAFAEGNRKSLKELLAREVYDEFAAEMASRDKRGELIDQSFVGISKSDITEAEVKGGTANVTVRFVSQLISATRDRSGAVTSGDPQKIKEVTDVWTFSRDVSSARARQNLNWRLIATQES
jgi:predicted lipid-binding transport protein (Tim44 family)